MYKSMLGSWNMCGFACQQPRGIICARSVLTTPFQFKLHVLQCSTSCCRIVLSCHPAAWPWQQAYKFGCTCLPEYQHCLHKPCGVVHNASHMALAYIPIVSHGHMAVRNSSFWLSGDHCSASTRSTRIPTRSWEPSRGKTLQ